MLVLHDPTTLGHRTVELLGSRLIPALECPQRITVILAALEKTNHQVREIHHEPETDSLLTQILHASHDGGYLHHLKTAHAAWVDQGLLKPDESILPECFPLQRFSRYSQIAARLSLPPKDIYAQAGFYAFDMSAAIAQGTWQSALASANLAVEAARVAVERGQRGSVEPHNSAVLALCRPPGHHCTTNLAGGYCYINNAVVAVHALRHLHAGQDKVQIAVLDIDFHHGNGTQEHFYTDPSVLYVSIHGEDEYPYFSGFVDEVGEGEGRGYNLNLPLPAGSSAESYQQLLDQGISRIEEYQPDYSTLR